MRLFVFNGNRDLIKHIDDGGWMFNFKSNGRLGYFTFETPVIKEITHSKGPALRYRKHWVCGVGIIQNNNSFCGVAFFDPHSRFLIPLIIFIGVLYASMKLHHGIVCGIVFYILISLISYEEDEKLIRKIKRMYES